MTHEEFVSRISSSRRKLLYIAHTMLPPGDCEDAVQSAILCAWEHLDQLKDEKAFEPWLTQILLNQCAQMHRRRKKDDLASDALAREEAAPQENGDLKEALEQMNPQERDLLMMHHDQGYTIREIAQKTGQSEDVLKMRLYRARNRLRVILISLLILLLLMSIAVGTGKLDIPWFLANRRAEPAEINTDHRSDAEISYDSLYLNAEIVDAIWDMDELSLLITYSLAGNYPDALAVHSGNIGVDGVRQDHIWVDGKILPVEEWANGRMVYTYFLDGWQLDGRILSGSEDFLPDGKGEAFFAKLYLDTVKPEKYGALLSDKGTLALETAVFVRDYASGEVLEQSTLTLNVSAPTAEEWRNAYEEYDR